ncbi:hypothetical protein HOP51_16225 [Halomonas sp. MCCC 1A11036]|uniref:Tripartite tricarboxylate transporter TctB family protein n=1 Tax=Billgrantia zhangzhouensis TaxID=2733481 RepID=A0ABS9AIP3_9GAMM|nr:hypothetical protein [Halomonas zhangzhouensis]MCE8021643.1 hypothetical protein [Halomonas zhangzhouensis]
MTENHTVLRMNFWSGLGVATFAVLLLTWVVPHYGGRGFAVGMHPRTLATLGAWIMLVCALALVLLSAIALIRQRLPFFRLPKPGYLWHQTWPFLFVLAFIVLVDRFPLTWVAPFLIGSLLLVLGERRWYVVLLTAMIPAIGLYGLTAHLMRIGVV